MNMTMLKISEAALESRARRAARRVGLTAQKSRRAPYGANLGGFMLVDPSRNVVINGSLYDLSAEEVIEACNERGQP